MKLAQTAEVLLFPQATIPVGIGQTPPKEEVNADQRGDRSHIAAAGVFHDLGNLIQIATSAINIIGRTPEMPARHAGPLLDRARSSLEHAGEMVRQSVGAIRDRALVRKHCDVAACLSDVAALIDSDEDDGFELVLEIEPDLPLARCDAVGLRRAVLNLVFSARDAIDSDGVVVIFARSFMDGPAGTGVEIRVIDSGVGMSRGTVARVFDPFFTTKNDGLGGIGLPTVAAIVRAAGGNVAIDSEPGVGTTVVMRLPAISPEDAMCAHGNTDFTSQELAR